MPRDGGITVGLSDAPPPPDGIAPSAGCGLPGPLGIATHRASDRAGLRRSGLAPERVADDSARLTFSVGSDTYRLRPPGAVWDANWYEEIIRPEEARRIIDAIVLEAAADVGLVSLLKTSLGGLRQGDLVLVRLRRRVRVGVRAESPPINTSPRRPVPSPAPSPEESTVPPEVAAAQAETLKRAAESGVPFCEECARAAAMQAAAATA